MKKMRKTIKKTGNSACIIIDKEDLVVYGLKIGDIVDIKFKKEGEKDEFRG